MTYLLFYLYAVYHIFDLAYDAMTIFFISTFLITMPLSTNVLYHEGCSEATPAKSRAELDNHFPQSL